MVSQCTREFVVLSYLKKFFKKSNKIAVDSCDLAFFERIFVNHICEIKSSFVSFSMFLEILVNFVIFHYFPWFETPFSIFILELFHYFLPFSFFLSIYQWINYIRPLIIVAANFFLRNSTLVLFSYIGSFIVIVRIIVRVSHAGKFQILVATILQAWCDVCYIIVIRRSSIRLMMINITQIKKTIFPINASLSDELSQLIFIDAYICWFRFDTDARRARRSLFFHGAIIIQIFAFEEILMRHRAIHSIGKTMFPLHMLIKSHSEYDIAAHMAWNVTFFHMFIHWLLWHFIRAIFAFYEWNIRIVFSFTGRYFHVRHKFKHGMFSLLMCKKCCRWHYVFTNATLNIPQNRRTIDIVALRCHFGRNLVKFLVLSN